MRTSLARDYEAIEFERGLIPADALDLDGARRVNGLPWRGQFSPGLVAALLEHYCPGGLVLDPFCGSGTALIEASAMGLDAHGIEVNPGAFLLAGYYTLWNYPLAERRMAVKEAAAILEEASAASDPTTVFSSRARSVADEPAGILAQAIFLLAMKNSTATTAESLRKYFNQLAPSLTEDRGGLGRIALELGDARRASLDDNSVNFVMTSPPYVNVFNYHQNYRKAVELLGWEVLPAARAEIGSNRKHRQNRLWTVIQYAQDIGLSLQETARVLEHGGSAIWVVGRESNVRGIAIRNPAIVYEMAVRTAGLSLIAKMERKFTSRYGPLVYEDILVFRKTENEAVLGSPTEVGRDVGASLLSGLATADVDVERDLNDAISAALRIEPSTPPQHNRNGTSALAM